VNGLFRQVTAHLSTRKPSPRYIGFSNLTLNPIEPICIIAVLKLSHHPAGIAVDGERSPWRGSGFKNRFVGRFCETPIDL
jgi:hypothetical protein